MHVVFAPDKFAGTLSALEAAEAMATGWARRAPEDVLVQVPMSDGGPGFVDVLHAALGGELDAVTVTGPYGDPTPATILRSGDTSYVESAQAVGLHLTEPEHRQPERATTRGLGELLGLAVDAGATRVVLGLGGSATNDAGAGLLSALGASGRGRVPGAGAGRAGAAHLRGAGCCPPTCGGRRAGHCQRCRQPVAGDHRRHQDLRAAEGADRGTARHRRWVVAALRRAHRSQARGGEGCRRSGRAGVRPVAARGHPPLRCRLWRKLTSCLSHPPICAVCCAPTRSVWLLGLLLLLTALATLVVGIVLRRRAVSFLWLGAFSLLYGFRLLERRHRPPLLRCPNGSLGAHRCRDDLCRSDPPRDFCARHLSCLAALLDHGRDRIGHLCGLWRRFRRHARPGALGDHGKQRHRDPRSSSVSLVGCFVRA